MKTQGSVLKTARLLLPLLGTLLVCPSARAQKPDILLVTIDTLRADHLPMWGATGVRTPELERLARESVIFRQAFASVPLTLPSHASILTGTYPQFHGLRDNSSGRLSPEIPTLATLLKRQGYATAAFVGSAVLDGTFGLNQGFDVYGDRFDSPRFLGISAERPGGEVVDAALSWLESRPAGPFFLWIHLYDPHAPYRAPAPFTEKGYRGEIEYVDSQLGRLFRALQEKGLWQSGLVALLADHGEDLEEHGEPTHGFFLYDSVMHIPFLLKFPRGELAGQEVRQPVRSIDLLPTLLQYLKIPVPSSVQGSGLLGYLLGKKQELLDCYMETLYPNLHFNWSSLFALRRGNYKYIEAPQPELYDVSRDPGEKNNLYPTHQALAHQLKAELQILRSRFEGTPPQQVELDPELRQRLQSLGYVTLAPGVRVDNATDLPDPKSKVGVYAEIYRGMQAYVEKRMEAALRHFQKALAQDSSVPLAYDYLGSTYLALERHREAIQSYQQALELAPGRPDIATNLAYAYLQNGQLQEAAEGFRLVTRLQPQNWQAWQLLGVAYTGLGDLNQAVRAFQEALQRNPSHRDTLFNLGTLYQQGQQFLRAIEVFRRLVTEHPEDVEGWNSLASSYQGAGLTSEARQSFERALQVDPSFAVTYYNYGNLLAQQNQLEEAAEKYRKAVSLDPAFALAYHNLAVVLEMLGRPEQAALYRRKFEALREGGSPRP